MARKPPPPAPFVFSHLPLHGRHHVDDYPDHRVAFYLEELDADGVRRVWWRCNTCGTTTDHETDAASTP